ncbi:MAG: HAMP domain-containing sensor histidine kinase [Agriterribacter sp.]
MKLLKQTIQRYLLYSVILLLIEIPLFYFVVQRLVLQSVDRDLITTKELLKPKIGEAIVNNTLGQLRFANRNISISIATVSRVYDSLASVEIFDKTMGRNVPHRILTSSFSINGKPCVLQVKTSLLDNFSLIANIVKIQLALLLLLLLGLLLINRNLSKKIWEPFYNTLSRLQNYNIDNHEPLVLERAPVEEFNDLNRSLEDLTRRVQDAYMSQKAFTENASHEMQSPLAVFQSKLELLMQTSPLTPEQAHLINDLADTGRRMSRINKSLVLLTKIENNQFAQVENIALQHIITALLQQYDLQVKEKMLQVYFEQKEDIVLKADKTLIEILAGNLLTNAIRHNVTGGRIYITVQNNSLRICNSGSETPLDDQTIFNRFVKSTADSNSIGLGLAIVNTICCIYRYKIQYSFTDNLHCFTVDFN